MKPLNILLADYAQKGAKLCDCGKMCNECAFKLNSPANLEEHNVDGAMSALAYEGVFNCHINDYEDAGEPCRGFLYAKQYFNNIYNTDAIQSKTQTGNEGDQENS